MVDHFQYLTRSLLGVSTVADAVRVIVDAARVVIPSSDLVGVSLRGPDGEFDTPGHPDDVTVELDRAQHRAGRGPCLEVAAAGGPRLVGSDDLRVETRWPEFAAVARGHGIGSVIAVGLFPAARPERLSGALSVYFSRPRGLSRANRRAALLLATHGSLALAHARSRETAGLRQAHLARAIDTRDIIGQAKGILMQRQGISATEAFELLRRTSQNRNVKLFELASAVTLRHGELDRH